MITSLNQRNVFYKAETMLWPGRFFLFAILCAVTIIVLSGKATASPSTPILGRQDCVGEAVAGDTLTPDEVREMIVGT
ncbi:hypothetical protein GGQ19_003174 [Salinibacter ruber]|nr:hypothetical protein [Salinibacter ruber]